MTYTLLKQKYGILNDLEPVDVNIGLSIEISNADEYGTPMTLMITVNGVTYYTSIEDGKCFVPRERLTGHVKVSVVTAAGTFPCTSLVGVENEKGTITVLPDQTEVIERLNKLEYKLSDMIVAYTEMKTKYEDILTRLNNLFKGYNI